MNWLYFGLLLSCAAAATTFGDVIEPTPASIFDDGRLRAIVSIDQATSIATIFMKFRAYGYFCLLLKSTMSDGDYNNIELAPGTVDILDQYSPGGHQTPEEDTSNDLTPIGYDTDEATYVIVKYSRKLNTGDTAGKDAVITFGQTAHWAYAWKTGSLQMEYHGKQYKNFLLTLDNKSTSSNNVSGRNMTGLELTHAIILSVLWTLFVDFAIFVKYLYRFRYRVIVHAILMILTMVGTIVLVALIIENKRPRIGELQSTYRAHYIMGLIVLGWVIFQCLMGALQWILLCFIVHPYIIFLLRKIHMYSGIVLVLLGKATVVVGWAMKGSAVGLAVTCSIMGVSLILLLLYIFWVSGSMAKEVFAPRYVSRYNDRMYAKDPIGAPLIMPSDPTFLQLASLPYCWPQVQMANFFIFNDLVYLIPSPDFHPGGRKVIEEIRGREVDRFIYGSMFTEGNPKMKPFNHPKQSMQIVGPPIAALPPNPICTLNDRLFTITSLVNIAPEVNIFYFSPMVGSILYRQPTSIRHIGQYFVVRAFRKTRLYTCLVSQRKDKRQLREQLLSMIIPQNQRLQRFLPATPFFGQTQTIDTMTALTGSMFPMNLMAKGAQSLPLIIKRYPKPTSRFTNQLYNHFDAQFLIQGPKGRGMCLQAVPAGNVVVIAGGTGIFPFLDLIDELFKLIVSNRGISSGINSAQIQAARMGLGNKSFHIFFSVNSFPELIMPDEMHFINSANSPLAQIYVRVTGKMPTGAFSRHSIDPKMKFARELVQQKISPLTGALRMVYICGPQQMYQDMTRYLNEIGVGMDRIFFV